MNKTTFIEEPELEFGGGRHIDIRFGLTHFGPLDAASRKGRAVRLGLVGDAEGNDLLRSWLQGCREGVPAKESTLPNLFPAFPGFGDGGCLPEFVIDDSWCREIQRSEFESIAKLEPRDLLVEKSVARYLEELQHLDEKDVADVYVCTLPSTLLRAIDGGMVNQKGPRARHRRAKALEKPALVWHDYLKAKCMSLRRPVQVARPGTFGGDVQSFGRDGKPRLLVQDPATRAWNILTALYYKAGGIPWRLAREASDYLTCYVGISFFLDRENDSLETSIAQVFNERGEGIIVRGGPAQINKDDLTPHLARDDAEDLLQRAVQQFRAEHKTMPARLVLHKTSWFDPAEIEGFRSAASDERICSVDLLSVRKSFVRFFREDGPYPPLRGTAVEMSPTETLFYTFGSVDFYRSYPGLYVPRPLMVRLESIASSTNDLLREILALTKMNWNSTQFVNAEPITVSAARSVGDILRYVPAGAPLQARYSFYM